MITEDGFIKQDDFNDTVRNAPIIEIKCPKCNDMTPTQDLGAEWWLCCDCGTVFETR